jgi:heme/copper-type cytochrome/quinol oxidase subunit 2
MTDAAHPAVKERTRAASWGVIPVALALASAVGVIVLVVLGAAGYDDKDGVWDDVSWVMFSLGGILALLAGAVAYVVGRRRRDGQAMRMGLVGAAWIVIALLIVVIVEAVS